MVMWLLGSLLTFAVGAAMTPVVRIFARRWGAVARPREDRWHSRPTALMGGAAVYAAFICGFLVFQDWLPGGARLILGGATLMFLTGLADDFWGLKAPIKLVLQLIVASVVVYFGVRLEWTGSEAFNIFVTIFWLVGITNAVNLLDNMDGLAAGVSAIACAFMTATFLLNGQEAQALLPALMGGAALGFLIYNVNPASIFMGDCGSMFLGFSLGGMALLSSYDRARNISAVLVTPVLIMLIPIFDTVIVTVTRKLSGRPVSRGGRDHASHRLVALGLSERRAVLLLYALAIGAGALGLAVRGMRLGTMIALVAVFILVLFCLGLYLGRVRIYETEEEIQGNTLLRALVGFPYKRRVMEIIIDMMLIALAYHSAYLLRFENGVPPVQMRIFLQSLPLVIAVQMLSFLIGGVYGGLWRYVGIADLVTIGRAGFIGVAASAAAVFGIFGVGGTSGASRAVFILDALLLGFLVSASRVSFRLLRSVLGRWADTQPDARPVLIYGAGDGGELLLRELINNPEYKYLPLGFIDDDQNKVGKWIHGYRIFGSDELPQLLDRFGVHGVLVSSASIPDGKLAALRDLDLDLGRMRIQIERESLKH
jgi:UDP-GlcNAc:undecaprenyl-phosphate GlcNAc-1-phosphate transferase